MKKAILFGASGFIGSYLLNNLLENPDYSQVTIVVRKPLGITHPKLKILIGSYADLPGMKADLVADDVFITLGTTKKKTPDKNEYYQIDHDYPVLAAQLAKNNGAKSVFVVTAIGANSSSGVFYIKTKGDTERDIIALDYNHTNIFRPSMIMGKRAESRPLERFLIKTWGIINPVFAGKRLRNYKGIKAESIALAMNNAAGNQTEKVKIYHWKEMNDLLSNPQKKP